MGEGLRIEVRMESESDMNKNGSEPGGEENVLIFL